MRIEEAALDLPEEHHSLPHEAASEQYTITGVKANRGLVRSGPTELEILDPAQHGGEHGRAVAELGPGGDVPALEAERLLERGPPGVVLQGEVRPSGSERGGKGCQAERDREVEGGVRCPRRGCRGRRAPRQRRTPGGPPFHSCRSPLRIQIHRAHPTPPLVLPLSLSPLPQIQSSGSSPSNAAPRGHPPRPPSSSFPPASSDPPRTLACGGGARSKSDEIRFPAAAVLGSGGGGVLPRRARLESQQQQQQRRDGAAARWCPCGRGWRRVEVASALAGTILDGAARHPTSNSGRPPSSPPPPPSRWSRGEATHKGPEPRRLLVTYMRPCWSPELHPHSRLVTGSEG